jgi:hypothetical protein
MKEQQWQYLMLVQVGINHDLNFVCGWKLNQLIMAFNTQSASCCWYKYLSLLTKFSPADMLVGF